MRATPRATTEARRPAAADRAGVGGRFWALLDSDDEDADGDGEDPGGSPTSPTPSDLIFDLFHAGYSEDDVATTVDSVLPVEDPARIGLHPEERKEMVRRAVHRRTAVTAVRPWKGPIPKVQLPNLTLFDLIHPDSWKVVKKKRPVRRLRAGLSPAAAADAPSSVRIRDARTARLNHLLG